MVQMALEFSQAHNLKTLLVLDAFFSSASVFRLASSVWSLKEKQPWVELIVRAKKNYVAYFPAQTNSSKKKGRPRK